MAFDRFIRAAFRGEPLRVFGDGNQVRNFTYVGDVVEAFLLARQSPQVSPVYNIGGGAAVRLMEVLQYLETLAGKPLCLEFDSKVPGDVAVTEADISLAQRELGYQPQTDWRKGIEAQVKWVCESL
jgi:UDP-glucose 4-epimerase